MDCNPYCLKCKRYTLHTVDEKWFLKPWKRKPRMASSKTQKCDKVRSQIFSAGDTETRTVMSDNTIRKRKSSGCGTVSSGMPPGLNNSCVILGRQLIPSKSSATSSSSVLAIHQTVSGRHLYQWLSLGLSKSAMRAYFTIKLGKQLARIHCTIG